MKIMFWNCRGCNSSEKRRFIRDFFLKERIDILCLQETKKDSFSQRQYKAISLSFNSWYCLPAVGGGLLVGFSDVSFDLAIFLIQNI